MLLFLIACLELNLALFNLLLFSDGRRTILLRAIAFSGTSYRRIGSNRRQARAKRFWIRLGRTSAWWDNFVSQTDVPEEWKENLLCNIGWRMRKSLLLEGISGITIVKQIQNFGIFTSKSLVTFSRSRTSSSVQLNTSLLPLPADLALFEDEDLEDFAAMLN